MQVQSVQNQQNFNGRAFNLSNIKTEKVNKIVQRLNNMNALKHSQADAYIAVGQSWLLGPENVRILITNQPPKHISELINGEKAKLSFEDIVKVTKQGLKNFKANQKKTISHK